MPGWTFVDEAQVTATGGTARYVDHVHEDRDGSEPMANIVDFGERQRQATWYVLEEWSGVDTVDVSAIEEDETNTSGCVEVTITPTAGILVRDRGRGLGMSRSAARRRRRVAERWSDPRRSEETPAAAARGRRRRA